MLSYVQGNWDSTVRMMNTSFNVYFNVYIYIAFLAKFDMLDPVIVYCFRFCEIRRTYVTLTLQLQFPPHFSRSLSRKYVPIPHCK